MEFGFIGQRYWLNLKRHRLTIIVSIIVFSLVMLLFGALYQFIGEEFVEVYTSIPIFQVLTGIDTVENPGMLTWLLVMSNMVMTAFPVVGIFLGVRMLPFKEKDGKELIFSTKMSPVVYFLENFVLIMILMPLIILPTYLIGVGFLSVSDDITILAISIFLPVFFTMVVAMITVFGASIKSSSKLGYTFGGIFFIVSFTLNILQSEIDFVKDINLMSQINAFQHALEGTWNTNFIVTCLILIAILSVLTIFFLYRTDYIESRSSYEKEINAYGVNEERSRRRSIIAKTSFIRTPVESVLSRVGWKNPAFRDQLQSSAGLFIIYAFITTMLVIVVLVAYPGDALMNTLFTDMSSIIDNPLVGSFMFGHTASPNLVGFLLFKLMTFHWIYYGPFLFIATYNIIMRDKSGGYDEITWSMPRTREKVILQRTVAMILYLWIIAFVNWIGLWIGELILRSFADVTAPDFISTVLAFTFIGLGYSAFLITFVALALIPHPKYLAITLVLAFMVAIILPVLSTLIGSLEWVVYLSPFQYFDVAGLLLNDVDLIGKVIPGMIIFGLASTIFLLSSIKIFTPKRDIA